ncbi:oxidoreductase [Rhizobium sp. R72]|uniref:Rieske (2Fe-2S) protein n=1 Tax=unclassified Rhizobium TaxID=2613769 RepID=UPI000B537EAF|nr:MULTISPECIES: Rieske (2Fe-2S) protein [unclassified Rhizobium]OWV97309.1 oxidoreductase [Rhizobium sp. R72]OWV97648.1 oxidoreductase [Rhizobium sp. R711]
MRSDTTGIWTPVALSADLPSGTVMPARTPAGPIALWRSASGRPAAAADRCPHRGMRLSHGFVRGEALSCIYHGWSYTRAGNCLRIPAHPGLVPPDTIRVTTQNVEEVDGVIWVAAGETTERPPRFEDLIPLRSLTANAGIGAIEAVAGAKTGTDGLLRPSRKWPDLGLLVVSQEQDQTLIHILLKGDVSTSQRISASRSTEALRRAAEDVQARGLA